MVNKEVLALNKEIKKQYDTRLPSDKESNVLNDIVFLFRRTADARNRNFSYFDGINLIDYINDSVLRFDTNIDEREDIEDWQAAVNVPFTRNKVLAILGKVMSVLPIASFIGRGEEDMQKGVLLTNLYEYVEELDDYEEFMTHMLLEAIVKGTSVGYEDFEKVSRKRRFVKGIGDDMTVNETTVDNTKLFGVIVPLEEFYPSSVRIRKIKDMPYCFWRNVVPHASFLASWGHYAKSAFVEPKRTFTDDEIRPYYMDYVADDVPEGSVEIIRYYDKTNDQYVIVANGVWLNPLDNEIVSPLPWNHKELPFWEIKFDFFGDFFYGKSLPDKLKSMQDVLNVLTNMLLDQSFLTIFKPIITSGADSIEDDYLRPGRRISIDTQGMPLNQSYMALDMGTPSGWHQYILQYTQSIMEQSSVDKVSQGVAGAGDRTTAQEIRIAADGVSSMLNLFARMVNYGIKRKAYLKAANILQFGMNQEAPILRQVMGEDSSKWAEGVLGVFRINDAVLTGGKRGTKVVEIYKDRASMPDKATVKARAQIAKADSGKEIEVVSITPEYLREFLFDIKMVTNPKSEGSKEVEKALQLEKVRVYLSFFPELIDKNELAAQTAEKMGDDPAKILKPEVFGIVPENKEVDPGVSTEPNGNTANNLARSARGGEQGSADMAALQANMQG